MRIIRKIIILFAIFLLFILSISPKVISIEIQDYCENVYFVAKNGDDSNPGTEDLPWLTIQKAANSMVAGDTVYIKEGDYNEIVNINTHSGRVGKYITYTNYQNDLVTINGSGIEPETSFRGLVQIIHRAYIKISGLSIRNGGFEGKNTAGIYVYGNTSHHIIIEDCVISNFTMSAIKVLSQFPSFGYKCVHNITIKNNTCYNVCSSGNQEGISFTMVNDFEICNNYIFNSYKECIDVKCGCSNGVIHHNRINTTSYNYNAIGIYVDAFGNDSDNISVYSNLIWGNSTAMSIATERGGTCTDITFYNNICKSTLQGFAVHYYTTPGSHMKRNVSVMNNIFYDNILCFQLMESDNRFENFTIRNNILTSSSTSGGMININKSRINLSNFLIDHNLFNRSCIFYGTDAVIDNPLFVNPSKNDFHYKNGSPAINNGSLKGIPSYDYEGNFRLLDSHPDIGAFETECIIQENISISKVASDTIENGNKNFLDNLTSWILSVLERMVQFFW